MERLMTIPTGMAVAKSAAELTKRMNGMIISCMEPLRKYYSDVLGKQISWHQMRALLEAQTAFVACILPADFSLVLRAVFGAWLLMALKKCRRLL
ncbi:MAG: ATP-binding protein [Prevotella sp.]